MSTHERNSTSSQADVLKAGEVASAKIERGTADTWPPAPGPQNQMQQEAKTEITHCPACSRKLLTQTSALCNWCGAKINNPEYQAHAAETRQMRDQTERHQIESVVQEETRYGILGRLKRRAKQTSGGTPPLV